MSDTNLTAGNGNSLWSILKQKKKSSDELGHESYLYFVGASNSGKSTIINKLLEKNEQVYATVALEYTFGRRSRQVSTKDICHIYELANGTRLSDLLMISINDNNVHLSSFVICIDLSKPEDIINILDHFLFAIRQKVNAILERLLSKKSKRPNAMKMYSLGKYGVDHPDLKIVNPFPVNIVIIGMKYDLFKTMETHKKKLLSKFLRCSLLFHSSFDEVLNNRNRQYLSYLAFKTGILQQSNFDFNKPIVVLAGEDSFSEIGSPHTDSADKSSEILGKKAVVDFEQWKQVFTKMFPPSSDLASPNPFDLNRIYG